MHIPELYDRKNTFKLNRLSKENGLEVIRRASKSARVKLQDSLIERILDDLCQEGYGMIYPPYLQIVGYNLYVSLNKKFELENSQNITESLYEKLGGLENIINHYFDGLLDRFTQEDKVMVGQILHTMVTNYYTKKRVTKEYLQVTLPECHNLDELLKNLIQDRIIMRSLGEYELISDLLALRVIQLIQNNTFLSPPVRRALEYIERNFSTPNLNSRRVAEAAGVSQMHLAVLFRKQIHKTINHQINAIRIAKAKEVLAKNRDRITDVAKKAGFKSLSSFSRKFKKIDGSSPLVYRNILTMKWQDSNLLRGV
jgi:AraC-like DNA-binding protein